jgi:hypothetical protein
MWGASLDFWARIGDWTLVGALILGGLTVLTSFASSLISSRVTSRLQQVASRETARLSTVAATANEGAAKANAIAAVANERAATLEKQSRELEVTIARLRKDLGPRQLDRPALLAALSDQPKEPVEIMHLRDDQDSFELAQQIALALEAAGWAVVSRAPIPPSSSSDPTTMSVDGQPSGVTVVANGISQEESMASMNRAMGRPWVRTPLTVLTDGLGAALGSISLHAGGPNAPPVGTLRVVIAPRR